MRGLVLFGADTIPNGVEVLASVHAAKEHARVAFQHQAAGAVHLHDLREAVPCISIPTCSYPAIFVCTPTTITCIAMTCSALYVLYGSPMLTCPAPFVPPPIAPCMSDLALTMLYV